MILKSCRPKEGGDFKGAPGSRWKSRTNPGATNNQLVSGADPPRRQMDYKDGSRWGRGCGSWCKRNVFLFLRKYEMCSSSSYMGVWLLSSHLGGPVNFTAPEPDVHARIPT